MSHTSRRSFVLVSTAGAGAALGAAAPGWGASGATPVDRRPTARTSIRQDPFNLGVASGDPEPDGFVIWTRLAPEPLAPDGLGGMPSRRTEVSWEIATDPRMRRIARRGKTSTGPELGHAVHVEVPGLNPDTDYWYRFRVGPYVSRVGRARTAPRPASMPGALAMSFVSCSQFEHGWFTAYRRLAEDQPDLVLHLGDYQYEYTKDTYVADSGNVRDHQGPETVTLENYRQRHAQYKTDLDLQAAHAAAPWLVVFDDHEVDNNWADETPEHPEDQAGFLDRRAAAFRAYYENMPLRTTSIPRGIDMQLFRRVAWGRLATFHMLDTRQFRSDQACDDGYDACEAAYDPKRTITGGDQERWLLKGFRDSDARWDILGQQVFFGQRDSDQGPLTVTSMDAWDGYAASRQRITQGWVDAGVRNPVVLTGDVHAHWADELKLDYEDPTSKSVGCELVCSSITSGGDGYDAPTGEHPWAEWNPHIKFWTNLRGYVNTTITPGQIDADFRCVPLVSEPSDRAFTRASFTIEDRVPALVQTADHPLPASSGAERLGSRSDAEVIRDTVLAETGPA